MRFAEREPEGTEMQSTINADVTIAENGLMTITHHNCGQTQTVEPAADHGTYFSYGSAADFCDHCESNDKPAFLNY